MVTDDFKAGASASLNKTITEIREFLDDHGGRPDADLRGFLRKKLADMSEKRYRRGFRRGHIQSYKKFLETGVFPKEIEFEAKREFFTRQRRRFRVTSKVD